VDEDRVLAAIASLAAQNATLTAQFEGFRSEVGAQIEGVRSELGAQIGGVRSELGEQIGGVRSELGEQIGGVRSELGEQIGGVRSELGEQIGSLHLQISELKADMVELRGELKIKIGEVRDETIGLRTAVMDRCDRLEDGLNTLIDDVSVNMKSAQHAIANGRATRKEVTELSELVFGMQRQIHRLQTDVHDLQQRRAS
jgi:regulator of replication initiation timing